MPSILVGDLYERGVPRSPTVRRATPVLDSGDPVSVRLYPRADAVRGCYTVGAAGAERDVGSFEIELERTSLHHGKRTWFLCPLCAGRVGILYLMSTVVACRKCRALRYQSQIDPTAPVRTRAQTIRAGLGQPLRPGGRPTRPKGMHRTTYERLWKELQRLEDQERARKGEYLLLSEALLDRLQHEFLTPP